MESSLNVTSNEQPDLLFLDTFSHDTSEELNLDLVQFPKSVYVKEIRIIPLGARVEGDFPGGVRLGATNPTKFHIDFFVNDLSKPGASTFESLGGIDYCQNGQIHMECSTTLEQTRVPTDGLVLRGWYTTITLAVYGNLTQLITEVPLVSANPPPNVQRPTLPREVATVPPTVPSQEWPQETSNPIPTYTSTATANPETYPTGYSENYDNPYRTDYYDNEAPKDPRYADNEWEKERRAISPEREDRRSPRSIDRERDRDRRIRRRSTERRSREPSRHRDRSREVDRIRSRTISRERDYIKGEYRPHSRSRSKSIDRKRLSSEREWDRGSYKKDEYRRHRDSSYDRSRGGSYDKRSGSFDRRSPYDKRAPSYERKPSYDRRAPSYDKQGPYERKRSPYSRIRGSSFSSRSPSRDDRKRPKSPIVDRRPISPPDDEPASPERSDIEYERTGKQIPRVEFYHQSYRHKPPIRSPSQEVETKVFDPQHPSLVTVPIVDTVKRLSPPVTKEEDKSMEAEQFEPILSDEDILDDGETADYNMDVEYDVGDYCGTDGIITYYNPLKCEWNKYENVNQVHLLATIKKEGVKDVLTASFDELCDVCSDLFKIYELTKTAQGREQKFYAATFNDIDNSAREEWVHQCEQIYISLTNMCKDTDIILRIFSDEPKSEEFVDIFELLITFCKIGLNFQFALAQQQATHKIRHMKCGIRLAEVLTCHKHSAQVMKHILAAGLDLPMLLLNMYPKEYMALSIRLMILKALDSCLSSKEAVDHFLKTTMYPKFDKSEEDKPKNGYQALISIMQSNPLSRIKFSISSLLKKLNTYEMLEKINEVVLKHRTESESKQDLELDENDVEYIIESIEEILYLYRSHCFHVSQPKRFLPVTTQFDINKDCSNKDLLQFFKIHKTMEAFLYLLNSPSTSNNVVLTSPIYDLLNEIIFSKNGIEFLYENMDLSELLFKTLIQPFNSEDLLYRHDLSNYSELQIMGLDLAYRLKTLYHLLSIKDLQAGKLDDNDLIDRLQNLYCLSFGCIGKMAVSEIIVMGDNAECLMEVLEKHLRSKSKNDSLSFKHKSPAKGYAIELIVSAVRFASDVPFLKKYGQRLLNVAKEHDKFEPSVSSILQEVISYLAPLEKPNLINGDEMAECVEILKCNLEHAPDLPGELVTCLRVLRHFCISDYQSDVSIAAESSTEEYVELKYKYNVLQLFSLDGVAHLCGILERIATHFDQPNMHTAYFASVKGLQLAQIILPCLRLLDEMLARVVRCRGSRFRDLTAAPVLLKTYGIVKTYPIGCVGHRVAGKAAESAVKALLAYSQPIADDASNNDSIRCGPWTSLCSEVISYTMTAPYTFVPGLMVFSELLPLPLPIQAKTPPSDREIADACNERRLWSAHLHALSNELIDMIQIICMSTYRPVVHMLRRVCVQIADLAPNSAATVAKAAIGAVCSEIKEGEPGPSSAARVLSFLACLVTYAPVKCAVLHAINTSTAKCDLPGALCSLLSLDNDTPDHVIAQEYAAHVLSGLFDVEVTLTPMTASKDTILANSLPNREILSNLLDATAACLSNKSKSSSTASSILRAYFVLTEIEYSFQVFRRFVCKKREDFGKFLKWSSESNEDRVECLGLFLDLIRVLRVEEGEGPLGRKTMMTALEVADMVDYTIGQEEHIIKTLDKVLKDRSCDEDVVSNAAFVWSQLENLQEEETSQSVELIESLPNCETLVAQFANRCVSSPECEPWDPRERGSPPPDPINPVSCDIAGIAEELLSAVGGCMGVCVAVRRVTGAMHTNITEVNSPVHVEARPTVSVSRGAGDSFRSRPPNTSRPPSLHVDDFTALTHRHTPALTHRGVRRGASVGDRGRFAGPHHVHYRQIRGRGGSWEQMSPLYLMGGGWPVRGRGGRRYAR